jgi:hypothetical protein
MVFMEKKTGKRLLLQYPPGKDLNTSAYIPAAAAVVRAGAKKERAGQY